MAEKRKPNEKDYITNKVLLVFTLCLAGVLVLMVVSRLLTYSGTWSAGHYLTVGLSAVGVVLAVLGAVKLAQERKTGADMSYRLLSGRNILLVGVVLAAIFLFVNQLGPLYIKYFYVLLPAVAVFYLIYHSYPREFFVIALDCGLAAGLLTIARRALNSANIGWLAYVCAAAALVLAGAQVALVLRIRKNGGIEGVIDDKRVPLFTSRNAYPMMLVSAAVLFVLVAAGAFLGPQIAYYLVFASFAYLFVTAVYYTVKML